MRPILAALLAACSTTPPPPAPQTPPVAPPTATAAPIGRATPVMEPTGLGDYLPATLSGQAPTEHTAEGPVRSVWTFKDRAVRITLDPIDDVVQTRASFELLGKDVQARMDGQELRGLRVQGNPAQLSRDLEPPHVATLTVVAANRFLVTVSVDNAPALDTPLDYATQIDIAGLTRLALIQAKAKSTAAP